VAMAHSTSRTAPESSPNQGLRSEPSLAARARSISIVAAHSRRTLSHASLSEPDRSISITPSCAPG
jgi:hypothetical protein